ncbi:MAG TPA: 4'-phosphopantetheinyl transferase superfamily protein [Stellaceae bacterium]|nr:4'-phosphopantetheinyl transferase superfamily protein [Stellaceae bacterium]
MLLLAMSQPVLRPRAEPSRTLPLEAIRAGFDSGAVQVVFFALSGLPAVPEGILTAEEEARARGLVAASVKRGFVAGRWLLRSVLGALTGVEARSLELQAGAHGKLFLMGQERLAPCFNLSHSGDLAALALVRERRVGIDIEAERPLTDPDLLARRILGPRERERFQALPERARKAALLAAWTRKEAMLKALGTGVSGHLRSIEGLPTETADAGDHTVVHPADPSATWSVRTLSMPAGFHGAIAIESDIPRLVTWQAVPAAVSP